MFLNFGEAWIYYIEIVSYETGSPIVIEKQMVRKKVDNIEQFEREMEDKINKNRKNKIKVQAAGKRRPSHNEMVRNRDKIGEFYMAELKKGKCNYQQVAKHFKMPVATIKNYIDKYFEINKIGQNA